MKNDSLYKKTIFFKNFDTPFFIIGLIVQKIKKLKV